MGRILAVGRAEAWCYDAAAGKTLDLPAEFALRQGTFTVPRHSDDSSQHQEVVDVPPQPLLFPQMPSYPGFETPPRTPCVDIVAGREGEAPETPHFDEPLPSQPNHELVETGVGTSPRKIGGQLPVFDLSSKALRGHARGGSVPAGTEGAHGTAALGMRHHHSRA